MTIRTAALFGLLVGSVGAFAQPPVPTPGVAKSEAKVGGISAKPQGGSFKFLRSDAPIPAGEELLILPGNGLVNNAGTVGLSVVGDYDGLSPLPVLETAIRVHPTSRFDMSVTLERGRIDLANRKKAGSAIVEVAFASQKWLITLEKPDTHVAIEVASRWAPGTRYQAKPRPDHRPITEAVLVVWKGSAEVDTAETTYAMTAPPGPAQLRYISTGAPVILTRLDQLPAWADPNRQLTPLTVQTRVAVEQFRELWVIRPEAAFETLLNSNRLPDRRVGLIAAGALDQMAEFSAAITSTKELDVWDFGITVVRHWLARGPAEEERFYRFLREQRGLTDGHAKTLIGLLYGFTDAEKASPETYEVLVEYLQHDNATIRNLAAWHLVRLVPVGKSYPFRPNSSKEEFKVTYNKWKALIQPGRLPPGVR